MAIGRISGPLLKENLTRDGVNLRFEDDLLYLKVTDPNSANHRIGIKNSNPAYTLDITGTARATTLLGGSLDIDEIFINDNTISSQIGDLILNAATNLDKVTINNDVLINGNLHATGSITADGSLQLGDNNTDNVVFAADINSNIMPNITDTYILGGTGQRWLNGNFKFLEIGDLYLSNNTVTTSVTNTDLNLNGNGTGSVVINNSLTVGPTGAITMPGNITIGGTLTVTGDIIGGPLRTDDIQIVGNRIETTSSNSNFEINTVGTGTIELLANSNVIGDLGVSNKVTATNISSTGQVTFATGASGSVASFGTTGNRVWIQGGAANNTIYSENNQLQIAPGGLNWTTQGALFTTTNVAVKYTTTSTSSTTGALTVAGGAGIAENLNVGGTLGVSGSATLGNLQVNGTTTLTGPVTASNNLTIGGTLTVTGDIVGGPLRTDDIQIVGNRIETTVSNSNFEINTVGTGSIELLANTNITGTFDVSSQATLASANVEDLTSGRVVLAGVSGELEDSTNLTFDGSTLTVTGDETVTGTATLGNVVVNGTSLLTGVVTANNNVNIAGTLTVTGDIVGGPLRTDDIQIVGNRIETTASNSNFEINTVGTGTVELLANTNVTGTFDVSSQATLASANVEDLTSGRIVLAGTSGELEDSSNLTFDGTTLTVTGNISVTGGTTSTINGITITGTTVDSADSSGITFTPLVTFSSDASVENNLYVRNQITTENILVEGNLTVLGTETIINSDSFSVNDGLIYIGEDNQSDVIDLGFVASFDDGTYQHSGFVRDATDGKWKLFEGVIDEPSLTINFAQATYATLKLGTLEVDSLLNSNLTSGRVVLAGTNGALEDSTNLTFDGTTLTITGDQDIVGNLDVSVQATLASANIEDLTSGRVVLAGTAGELEDSANLTFDGTTLTVTGDQHITGDLDVDGDITLGGNIRIGNQDVDTVTVVADFTSDLFPNESNTYDIGRANKAWRTLYASEFDNNVININDNTIKTTVSNADLELRANGTGNIIVPSNDVTFSQNLDVTGTTTLNTTVVNDALTVNASSTFNNTVDVNSTLTVTGAVVVNGDTTNTGNVSVSGNLIVTGDIVGGPLITDDIRIDGNTIKTTASNSNLELDTVGTGSIELLTNSRVSGTFDVTGNTTLGTTDADTVEVKAEFISNLVPDTTDLYDLGIAGKRWNQLNTNNALIGDVSVSGSTIETTLLNSDLYLNANGTGSVIISNLLTLGSSGSLSFSGETVNFNNILIDGDGDYSVIRTIDSNTNLYLDAAGTGTINLTSNTNIVGNLDVTGDITLGGNIRIGDTTLDTVTVQADFTSDLIPNASNLYDLGASDKQWRIVNAAEFDNNVININDNVITTKVSNADLELRANGTGTILVPQNDVTFSQALTVNGNTILDVVTINDTLTVNAPSTFNDTVDITGNLTVTGDTTQQGNLTVTQNLIVTGDIVGGPIITDDIRIAGNRIETTASNSNLELDTVGTGTIELLANSKVTGTFEATGLSTLAQAEVSDLTATRLVLAGVNGRLVDNADLTYNSFGQLSTNQLIVNSYANFKSNVKVEQLTTGRVTFAGADQTLADSANFTYNGTTLTVTGNETVTGTVIVGTSITVPIGNITTLNSGEANIDSIRIDTNVISTTESNADLVLDPSGSGIVYISGTGAVRIPAGNTFERPATGEAGFIRYNSQTNNIEAWNGVVFTGISGGSSADANGDTLITFETAGNNEDIIRFFTGVAGETPGSTLDSVERVTISNNGLTVDNNVRLQNNYIETTVSNSDLELRAHATGRVYVPTNNVEIENNLTVNTATYLNTLDTSGQATLASANVEDLTAGRVVLAGVNGELEDSANLTFNGTLLTVTGNEEITGTLDVTGNTTLNYTEIDELLVSGKVRISGNVIENTVSDEDLIIRASGSGRVILDGSGSPGDTGNVFATDPLLTLNSSQYGANTYDSGLIIERGSDINKAFIWDESADAFALVSTIEQGTVRGNVAITNYQDLHVASIKLNSESINKVTFTDASKIVRTIDSGAVAYVDGVIKFNTGAEAAIPTGTTAERPVTPQEGTVRFNTTDLAFEGYAEGSWRSMGFGSGTAPTYQGFLANGTDFEFTLSQVPLSAAAIMVAINGVVQEPNIAYTVDGSILRFIDDTSTVVAPEQSDRIDVRFLSMPAVTSVHTVNFTADGVSDTFDTQFQIPNEECIMVFVNSVYQDTEVYSINGTEVTFVDETPSLDDRVNIVIFPTIIAPDLPTKTYVDQQITLVSNTATDDAIAFAIALG